MTIEMKAGVRLAGALDLGTARDGTAGPVRWRCALVNNMPDAAFNATERQFAGLLEAASGCETVALTRHSMAGVPASHSTWANVVPHIPAPMTAAFTLASPSATRPARIRSATSAL